MSFFAVIDTNTDKKIKVVECHLNLWSLSAIYHRRFYFDIGLRLSTELGNTINTLRIALPFGTYNNPNGIIDLEDTVKVDQNARLIFGGEVVRTNEVLKYPSSHTNGFENVHLIKIADEGTKYLKDSSGNNFSVWDVAFLDNSTRQNDAYIRIRFPVKNFRYIWKWIGLIRSGAIVDFRIADNRGTVPKKGWADFENDILPIEFLNLFVIAPTSLNLVASSPTIYYIRLLEGSLWENYLKRPIDVRNKEKLLIYQWRNKKIKNSETLQNEYVSITQDKPFKAFLNLTRQNKAVNFINALITAILVVCIIQIVDIAYEPKRLFEIITKLASDIFNYIKEIPWWTYLLILLPFLWELIKEKTVIYEIRDSIGSFLVDAEKAIISILNIIYSFIFRTNKK